MKIAYLAPEIPALSATFVYNEMLELQSADVEVRSYSIHRPAALAKDSKLSAIRNGTCYLYERGLKRALADTLKCTLNNPLRSAKAFLQIVADVVRLGVVTRNALGQCMRFVYAHSLARDLIKTQCQHLHIHFAHVPTDVGMYAATLAGISYSVTAHANDLFERGYLLPQKVARSAFFGTISEYNCRYLRDKGVDATRLAITRCGVDARFFSKRSRAENTGVIGAVGRMVEKKGFDTLILAVAELKKKQMDCRVQLAGSGPLEDELKTLAIECDVSDRVEFLGALSHGDVPGFLAGLDVFVLPCKTDTQGDMDGIPVVLMEAMLSGIPVISTYLSGIPELVIDRKTGLLVEQDDARALAEAIQLMLGKDELRSQMTDKAVEHVRQEFSLAINVDRLKQKIQMSIGDHV